MNLGIKIKQLRESQGVSQAELAHILEIEQSSLSKIESGKTEKVSFMLMDKVCNYFDKDFSYFSTDSTINNNIKTNNGVVVNVNKGKVTNQVPKVIETLLQDIVTAHKDQAMRLADLEKELKKTNK